MNLTVLIFLLVFNPALPKGPFELGEVEQRGKSFIIPFETTCDDYSNKHRLKYLDLDSDGKFDVLTVFDCEYVYSERLDPDNTLGSPPKEYFTEDLFFDPVLVEYDSIEIDVEFKVELKRRGKIYGSLTKKFGEEFLVWKSGE